MLRHGIPVNAPCHHGLMAFVWAAGQGNAETVKLPVDFGADLNPRDDRGKTAIEIAEEAGHPGGVALLRGGLP